MNSVPVTPLRLTMLVLFSSCLQGAYLSYFGSALAARKWTLRSYLFATAFLFIDMQPYLIMPDGISKTIQIPLTAMAEALFLWLILGQKGFALLKNTLLVFGVAMLGDFLTGMIVTSLFDPEVILAHRSVLWYEITVNLLSFLMMLMLARIYILFMRRTGTGITWEKVFRVVRPVALVACLLALFLRIMSKSRTLDYVELFRANITEFIVLAVLLIIGSSYAYQDIRYLRQANLNSTLLQNQEIQNALLEDTRVFRHNIANMLYGFQGALMSGDRTTYETYYKDLIDRCAVINNENVANLQRIPAETVKALLLNKIRDANEKNIPFYIYVDQDLIYRGLKDTKMCQVLGVLVDNAMEAAAGAGAPLITVEFHNAGSDMETVVRNTYDEEKGLPGQNGFIFSTASKKEGHEGLGLKAVKDILKEKPGSVCNLYLHGRFVEASLLIG